jgi:hypothetical protein
MFLIQNELPNNSPVEHFSSQKYSSYELNKAIEAFTEGNIINIVSVQKNGPQFKIKAFIQLNKTVLLKYIYISVPLNPNGQYSVIKVTDAFMKEKNDNLHYKKAVFDKPKLVNLPFSD